jgi:hypothetical protein
MGGGMRDKQTPGSRDDAMGLQLLEHCFDLRPLLGWQSFFRLDYCSNRILRK